MQYLLLTTALILSTVGFAHSRQGQVVFLIKQEAT